MPEGPRREGVFIPQWAVTALLSMLPISFLLQWAVPSLSQLWDAQIALGAAVVIGFVGYRRERRRLKKNET